jgi:hypothetical protein
LHTSWPNSRSRRIKLDETTIAMLPAHLVRNRGHSCLIDAARALATASIIIQFLKTDAERIHLSVEQAAIEDSPAP